MFAATDTGAWIVLSVTATLTRPVCCWADAGAASARGSMRPTRVAMRRRFAVCVWCMWFLLPIAARRQASGQGTRDRGRGWHRPPPSAHNRSERHLLAPSLAPERNPPSLDLWLVMGIPAGRGPTTATGRRRQPPNVPEVGAQLAPAARVTRARVAPSRCHLGPRRGVADGRIGSGPAGPRRRVFGLERPAAKTVGRGRPGTGPSGVRRRRRGARHRARRACDDRHARVAPAGRPYRASPMNRLHLPSGHHFLQRTAEWPYR